LLSWYGLAGDRLELEAAFRRLCCVKGRFYKLVVTGTCVKDELAPLYLLKTLKRSDTVAYAAGPTGSWSRLLAPLLGAPTIFGLLEENPPPVGEFTIRQLLSDYDIAALPSVTEVYGIVGEAVRYSISPRIHNAAYQALGYPALYVPFAGNSFQDYWREMVHARGLEALGLSLRGLTVASPHKEAALALCAGSSQTARRAGSANVAVPTTHGWIADTTDPQGVLAPLRRRGIPVASRSVAVVGCGGAGRGVALALARAGATVTLVNRGLGRGLRAASRLGLPFIPLASFHPAGFDVVVNATPVGGREGEVPFAAEALERQTVVVDLVYGLRTTELVSRVRQLGRVAVDGFEVLSAQVSRQFLLMTGQHLPMGIAQAASCHTAGSAGAVQTSYGEWQPSINVVP
jgi:3-dehydroquinate dehydratase/shikimate dehydrogenase